MNIRRFFDRPMWPREYDTIIAVSKYLPIMFLHIKFHSDIGHIICNIFLQSNYAKMPIQKFK